MIQPHRTTRASTGTIDDFAGRAIFVIKSSKKKDSSTVLYVFNTCSKHVRPPRPRGKKIIGTGQVIVLCYILHMCRQQRAEERIHHLKQLLYLCIHHLLPFDPIEDNRIIGRGVSFAAIDSAFNGKWACSRFKCAAKFTFSSPSKEIIIGRASRGTLLFTRII